MVLFVFREDGEWIGGYAVRVRLRVVVQDLELGSIICCVWVLR